jgi:hypothetical protein
LYYACIEDICSTCIDFASQLQVDHTDAHYSRSCHSTIVSNDVDVESDNRRAPKRMAHTKDQKLYGSSPSVSLLVTGASDHVVLTKAWLTGNCQMIRKTRSCLDPVDEYDRVLYFVSL